MRNIYHSINSNLKENKEDWYYLCNDAEQALIRVKEQCKDDRAIKSIERMIIELNNIRMEQYEALNEYALICESDESDDDSESFRNYVDTMLRDGALDDPDYVETLSDEEYENLLVNTWMKDPEVIEMYNDLKKHNAYIKVYQIKDTNIEDCGYAFMNYDKAKDKINLDDYDEVATIELYGTDEELLEKVFELGNTDKSRFDTVKPMRSISVSDIIDIDDEKYYVDSFGFKKLEDINE